MGIVLNTPLEHTPLPYVNEYLRELEVELKSASYVRGVKLSLGHFSNFCHHNNIAHPDLVTRTTVLEFQAWTQEKGWARSTQIQHMKHLRGWINWLTEVGYINQSPWVRIRVGSVKKSPRPLEDDDILSLFLTHRREALRLDPFKYHRREALLVVLYMWGLRIHEAVALDVEDVSLDRDYVRCINKGGGSKMMPYSPAMKQVLKRYLSVRARKGVREETALFITNSGRPLSVNHGYSIIKRLAEQAGINATPHRLRDTAATKMLDEDMPVEQIMKVLGHTRREQTLAYSRVNDHKVAESFREARDEELRSLLE